MSHNRTLGITIYAYLTIAMAVLSMLIYVPFAHNLSSRSLIIISNILYICIGMGLLSLKRLARVSFLVISWIFICLFVLILLKVKIPVSANYFILTGLFIYLFGIYYFTRDRIKKQFI